MNKLFRDLDHWEQVEIVADLARQLADTFAECDRIDNEIMDQRRHEVSSAQPWEQVRRELGLVPRRRQSKKR